MLLKWNKDNLKVIPLIATTKEAKTVELTRSIVTLFPGVNEVTDGEYLVMKPHIQANINDKTLIVLDEKTQTYPGKPQEDANSLIKVPVRRATELIKEIYNPETLNLWYALETRESIRVKIADRMKFLKVEEKAPENLPIPEDVEEAPAKKKVKKNDTDVIPEDTE